MNRAALRAVTATTAALILVAGLSACDKLSEPFKDAPRTSTTNSSPADVVTNPDGFSNLATKCDHGNRVYVVFHGDSAYAAVAVVPADPTCTR